jgi:hypothetical protein
MYIKENMKASVIDLNPHNSVLLLLSTMYTLPRLHPYFNFTINI